MNNWTFFKRVLLHDDAGIPHFMLYKTTSIRWDKKGNGRMRKMWKYGLNIPHIGTIYLTKKQYEECFTSSTFKWKMYHGGNGVKADDVAFFASTVMKHDLAERKAAKLAQQQTEPSTEKQI